MAYDLEWREEAAAELGSSMFSKKDMRAIISKVERVTAGLPQTLSLKTVVPIRGASLSGNRAAMELKVGSGHRVALVVDHARETVVVYMVGTHDYAYAHYLTALEQRVEP